MRINQIQITDDKGFFYIIRVVDEDTVSVETNYRTDGSMQHTWVHIPKSLIPLLCKFQ